MEITKSKRRKILSLPKYLKYIQYNHDNTFPIFWFRKMRRSILVMFVLSIIVNIGMWFERFVIIVTTLANDFMPSAWDYFTPTFFDFSILIGSFGLFFTLFLLFLRFLPMVAIAEIKGVLPQADPHFYEEKH